MALMMCAEGRRLKSLSLTKRTAGGAVVEGMPLRRPKAVGGLKKLVSLQAMMCVNVCDGELSSWVGLLAIAEGGGRTTVG